MTKPITTLKGIGTEIAEKFARLSIETIDDMLFHLPMRYEDRTEIQSIADAQIGENALIEGVIQSSEIRIARKRSLLCTLSDNTGSITLRFFHFYPAQQDSFKRGERLERFFLRGRPALSGAMSRVVQVREEATAATPGVS